MTTGLLIVQILNGLQLGILLFLVAAGLTLVFGVMDFINLAHGVQYMLGAYLAVTFVSLTGSFVLGLVLALAAALVIGLALEFLVFRHLYERDHLDQVLATFGLILLLNQGVKMVWGAAPLSVPVPAFLAGNVALLEGILYPTYRFALIGSGLAVGALLWFVVEKTRTGMLLRAGASNAPMVSALGVDNILGAIAKPVLDSGAFLISPNAGPSTMAGKACNQNFFVTSYQNDQVHEVLGKYAQDQGYKRAYIIAPNYQAGKDSLAGFKRYFKGEVVDEVYAPLTSMDFASDLAKIASTKPDVVFAFLPGGLGVNFVKQWSQAGLQGKIPFLSAFTVDESTLPAQQDAAVGLFGGMTWAPNMDNPQTKAFVSAYEAAYKIVPGSYAQQAYDAAMLIDSAVKAAGGTGDKDKLRAALKKADFTSLRGKFKFNTNGFPIQDFYLVKAAKRADGKFQTEIVQKVFADYADPHAKECALK